MFSNCRGVAGGYDVRCAELGRMADTLNVHVTFLLSVPDNASPELLRTATVGIYTPQSEHSVIVPLEAMTHVRRWWRCVRGGWTR
jgi:hypothetical protein